MPIYQPSNDAFSFCSFSTDDSKKMLYTKYNFNFVKYNVDYHIVPTDQPLNPKKKSAIFYDFLIKNTSPLYQPDTVKEELKRYFNPITQKIIDYMNRYGYSIHNNYMHKAAPNYTKLYPELLALQFELYPFTEEELPRVQDFIYNADGKKYSKYNFDFDSYSNDFNIWGSKLLVFTDFVIRNYLLSNTLLILYGYGIYIPFEKYFINYNIEYNDYLQKYSITSIYKNIYKNIYNIDFIKYRDINSDLSHLKTVNDITDHYFTYGQFEFREVPLFPKKSNIVEEILKSVCIVSTNDSTASGFLYRNKNIFNNNDIYLVSCYHVVKDVKDKNIIYAIVNILGKNIKVAFRFIGCEIYADLMVAIYDPTIAFNIANNVDLSQAVFIDFNMTEIIEKGDKVFSVTNLGSLDDYSYIEGYVVDNAYYGPDHIDNLKLGSPRSYLLDLTTQNGVSGSMLFLGDIYSEKILGIGIINSSVKNTYSICIDGFISQNILTNIIGRWEYFSRIYTDDQILLNNYIKTGYTKRWLGVDFSYYNDDYSPKVHKSLTNYNIMGGVVVNDFIIGWNRKEKCFVYDIMELNNPNCFKINTPLLNSNMYNKFISSSKNPIVITAITLFDGVRSVFDKFDLGRYENQHSLEILTYGFTQMANITNNIKQHASTFLSIYGDIILEYYYFDGVTWIKDTEIISGNEQSKYNLYTDPMGYIYKQHNLEFPIPLLTEMEVYEIKVAQVKESNGSITCGDNNDGDNSGNLTYASYCTSFNKEHRINNCFCVKGFDPIGCYCSPNYKPPGCRQK